MEFRNLTPFPAQAFEGVDQEENSFFVVVLRQTLNFSSGTLEYAAIQTPLCESDIGFEDACGTRFESDLCHYKPKCDLIVNATAYAPQHATHGVFTVRLALMRPATPAPLPLKPQGLNQFESAAPEIMARWRQDVAYAKSHPVPGVRLMEKTLLVSGTRQFKKKSVITRVLQQLVRIATFGMLQPNPWKLTKAQHVIKLPLRDQYAYGGECRINSEDPAAKHLAKRNHMTLAESMTHPDGKAGLRPIWHTACESNIHGTGYSDSVYLKATRSTTVTAPCIESVHARLTARHFHTQLHKQHEASDAVLGPPFQPAGFGIRSKAHPARRALGGTIDQAFITGAPALPPDFDFAFWNAAPPDQQVAFLQGDETLELVNMCPFSTAGSIQDAQKNTVLHLTLMRHACFLLCREESGGMFRLPLAIDTLIVEPEQHSLTLIWRGVLEKNSDAPLRVCEARMVDHDQRDTILRELDVLHAMTPPPGIKEVTQ